MQTLHTIAELRAQVQNARRNGQRVALVPTMGNLHAGHISLIEQARRQADLVVSSIFVNPLQFGAGEDLDKYPRTLAEDQARLTAAGCDILFAPSEDEVYPNGREQQTLVEVPGISDLHCGESRPGHFRGVTTVVAKLFGMVQPDLAIFGEKDYQQLQVIRRMTEDLCLPIEIQGGAIVRAENGLALSSRNGYLNEEELAIAPTLNQVICETVRRIEQGDTDFRSLEEQAQQQLEAAGFRRDYFRIVRQFDLQPADSDDTDLVILAAAYLGPARLIDNQPIKR